MRTLKTLNKCLSQEKIENSFFVFDTETTKLEPQPKNFVFGVIYGKNYCRVIKTIKDFRKEFEKKKYKGKYIFAHNAEFDLLTIFGNIYKNVDSKAIFNGKFITAKYNGITFGDSMNIYPSSLKKIGEIVGLKKLDNEKVRENKLRKNNITKQDIEYCIRDCEIVYEALLEIFCNVGTVKLTISSLALFDFRNKHLSNDIIYNDLVDEFFESYYGGRTECFKLGNVNCNVYDINSLYPYIMKTIRFPDVRTLKKDTKVDVNYLNYCLERFEGLAKIDIIHKDTYFGFLPFRSEKLLFPVGEFTTTVNFNELRFALKHKVVEIKKVHYVIYANPIESIFKDFIILNYNNRKNSKNELERLILKLKMNSLYGKFASRIKFTTEYFEFTPYEIIKELEEANKFFQLKLFNENRKDCFLITENEKYKNSFFAIPTFASYITSGARIKLLENLLANEKNSVCYCDTDSIFVEKEFIGEVGNEIGQFKLENKSVYEIRGLKNYSYYEKPNLETQMFYFDCNETIKGVNKNSIEVAPNTFINTQYFKTKEALRRNKEAGSKKEVIKELTNDYNKRIILEDKTNTKPIKL